MTIHASTKQLEHTIGLDHFVPFKIYRVMARLAVIGTADYAAWGISIQEARLLMLVSERSGISAGDLCDAACVEASALSHMLRHLVAKMLLRRERNPTERRSVQIYLTEKGEALVEQFRKASARHQEILLAGMKKKDVVALQQLLDNLLLNVSQQQPGPSPWLEIANAGETRK
jgi:MarR family transcriptional regulator, repressor of the mexAB-oprM multidrug resistance operon